MDGKRKLEDDQNDGHARKRPAIQPNATDCFNADAPEAGLGSFLDLSTLSSPEHISARFESIAHELLCTNILSIVHNSVHTDYEILELEFYLQKAGCHEDPFTHGSREQERSGQWYFHRMPCRADNNSLGLPVTAAGSYRDGTRKGLDLTIGAQLADAQLPRTVTVRGGALLRTLRRLKDRKLISGPSLLVDEVLRASGASSISNLVNDTWNKDIAALTAPTLSRSTYMYLRSRDRSNVPALKTSSTVYRSPRVGLDLSHPETTNSLRHPRVAFVDARYRYFTHPELLTTKGRMQTFCGLYTALRESNGYPHNSIKLKQELCRLMAYKEQNVVKLLADYKVGYESGTLKSFLGSAGKGACQSSSTYLKMMGTLQRVKEQIHQA
ncbi:hypothetical protein SCLCIDRAFT_1215919 [Scleroderma citrinum Foug A]|uniref:Uncharacterized protein n=1 Tax=Scleroderma citrinum Foug A TaxID=1036808 RepID=A0A0C3DZ25_9AGAM|nr:hypothetical protein SCLCIDRAFT_1215919 [Scleroderma citrinum Foug A]